MGEKPLLGSNVPILAGRSQEKPLDLIQKE
jgi:hypothetical protein